jgi:hypothetical protein
VTDQQVCFSSIKEVLGKSGVQPRQIGVVIVNCSLFNPTPSLSAMVMNHFKMGSNTINYNLGGMGCSGERWLGGPGEGRGAAVVSLVGAGCDGSSQFRLQPSPPATDN